MRYVLPVLAAAFIFAACGGSKPAETMESAPAASTAPAQTAAPAETTEKKMEPETMSTGETRVELKAENFTYGKNEIKVKKGDKLIIAVNNAEGVHDIKIDELNVNSGMIPVGQTKELTIPTDKAGTYEYYCSVGQHRANGMKGTLIIE